MNSHRIWKQSFNPLDNKTKSRMTGNQIRHLLSTKREMYTQQITVQSHWLTSLVRKSMVHIHVLYSTIKKHLSKHNILTDAQHGFRSTWSCDTQLISTTKWSDKIHWPQMENWWQPSQLFEVFELDKSLATFYLTACTPTESTHANYLLIHSHDNLLFHYYCIYMTIHYTLLLYYYYYYSLCVILSM